MQGIAIGMYLGCQGFADIVYFVIAYMAPHAFDTYGARMWYWGAGIGGNLLSLSLLFAVHKAFSLGLSIP